MDIRSRMKFSVARMSMIEGTTGTTTLCERSTISCSSKPEAPAGASMISCCVCGGTNISKLRRRPYFSGAPFAA